MAKVLNIGGGASRELPKHYRGWSQELLDIDKNCNPDIVCDARKMTALSPKSYDAVFSSHMLEHFFQHEVPLVLSGVVHVLKDAGFLQLAVPDIQALFEAVVTGRRDIDDEWYRSPGGSISFHDVLYGWGIQVSSGNEFYRHKTAFTELSLKKALRKAKFFSIMTARDGYNLHAFAFKSRPSKSMLVSLGL